VDITDSKCRAEIEKINIPTYIVASYSSFVHTMGSVRGWMQINTGNKWLRWDPYQEWYDLWAVRESVDELAAFFDRFLKDEKNEWEQTPRVRMASLTYGDKEAIYPIVEEDFPIPRTNYRKLFLGEQQTLSDAAPSTGSIVKYNSESGASPVASARFDYKFDKPTRLMGLPKAVLYMSCPDLDDMVVYVLIRKLDKDGNAMITINIPWSAAPYNKVAEIPESDYSNLMIYLGPTGVLRASHRKIEESKSLHSQYPFHSHDEVQKIPLGEIFKLEIGLWVMGVDYEAGESLSVQVSGEYPLVDEFGGRKKPQFEERNKGTHQVHIGGDHASHVILPFV
jgi:predicted acyl esterase